MNSIEWVLEGLNCGDDEAAREVFVAFEPYLRKVVRRQLPAQLRVKFDSHDVVQSVWCDLLVCFRERRTHFVSDAQLRAFLLRATRNRLIDRVRQHSTSVNRERPVELSEPRDNLTALLPRASQVAEAGELWARLLRLCPARHHEVLRLRRDGYTLDEISRQTGLHEGSVRRILRSLVVRLAVEDPLPPEAGIR